MCNTIRTADFSIKLCIYLQMSGGFPLQHEGRAGAICLAGEGVFKVRNLFPHIALHSELHLGVDTLTYSKLVDIHRIVGIAAKLINLQVIFTSISDRANKL